MRDREILRKYNQKLINEKKELEIKRENTEIENNNIKLERDKLSEENDNLLQLHKHNSMALEKQKEFAEELKSKISNLESERDKLKELIDNQTETYSPVSNAIRERIELLNKFLANEIVDNITYGDKYCEPFKKILDNRNKFTDDTRLAFKVSHPQFIKELENYGLTTVEINYLCLYAIGLKGKDIGIYMKFPGHINLSSVIRKKLGLTKNDTNIRNYVQQLLKNTNSYSYGNNPGPPYSP